GEYEVVGVDRLARRLPYAVLPRDASPNRALIEARHPAKDAAPKPGRSRSSGSGKRESGIGNRESGDGKPSGGSSRMERPPEGSRFLPASRVPSPASRQFRFPTGRGPAPSPVEEEGAAEVASQRQASTRSNPAATEGTTPRAQWEERS